MIIDKNICMYFETEKGCSDCLCVTCMHYVPFGECALHHVKCDEFQCHAIEKCMAFFSVPEKGVHS